MPGTSAPASGTAGTSDAAGPDDDVAADATPSDATPDPTVSRLPRILEPPSSRRFDLALLAPLDALLEERNVTRAATRLCVTQPTMSGILRRLRDHFDDPLLVRDGRTLTLSPLGASLVDPVRQSLLQIDAMLAIRPDFDPATARRRFRIMASDYSIATFLAPTLRAIARDAPGLGFTIEPMEAPAERVRDGTVDLSITGDPAFADASAGTLRVETLFDEGYLCIVDEAHPLRGRVTLDQFRAHPQIVTRFLEAPGPHGVRATRSPARVPEPDAAPVTSVPGFLSIPALVRGGDAIGMLPERLWRALPDAAGLRALETDFDVPGFTERLLWHSRFESDPGFGWVRDRLRTAARALGGPGSP